MSETITIPVPDKHIRLVWKGINEALVYSDSNTNDISAASNILTHVEWSSSMQHPILRYLAIQSYHIFESTQLMTEIDLENILLKSKEYRAILAECEEQITVEIQKLESALSYDEEILCFLTTNCNTIKDYQMIWHLAEIFFIKLSSPGYFIQDLQNWLLFQQPQVGMAYNSLMDEYNMANGDIDIEMNDNYWQTIWYLAIHGRQSELLNLLACNTHSNSQAFRTIRDVIGQMPVFNSTLKGTIEFDFAWNQWYRMAKINLTDSYLLKPYPGLDFLAQIILGNQEIYYDSRVLELTEGCWFYAIVPYFLYTQPLIDAKAISSTFKDFKRGYIKSTSKMLETSIDLSSEQILGAISSIFSMDLGEFVKNISKNSNNWWMCAHLVDLIEKINPHLFPQPLGSINRSNIFNDDLIQTEVTSVRESFILQYASGFASHPSLVMMAMNYLHFCSVSGRNHINQIIDHLDMPNDKFATMIHSWCVKRKHDVVASSICKRRCMDFYKSDQLGNSLMWAMKGNDTNFISRIADKLLRDMFSKDCTTAGAFALGLIDCLKDISLGIIGKKMTFVIQFYEVQSLMSSNKLSEAARLFVNLMESQLVSRHFNLDILHAITPLISNRGLFKSKDIYQLLELLEEAECGDRYDEVRNLREILVDELSHACLSM